MNLLWVNKWLTAVLCGVCIWLNLRNYDREIKTCCPFQGLENNTGQWKLSVQSMVGESRAKSKHKEQERERERETLYGMFIVICLKTKSRNHLNKTKHANHTKINKSSPLESVWEKECVLNCVKNKGAFEIIIEKFHEHGLELKLFENSVV